MQVLRRVPPSPEQIGIIRRIQSGVSLIRGAAGSGKTTTALLALRATTGATVNQLRNEGLLPVNVLVLTYNNSLRSYISAVAEGEMGDYSGDVRLFISTFDKWALGTLGWQRMNRVEAAKECLTNFALLFQRDTRFVVDEVEYLLGRFPPERLADYIGCERTGRGASPAMNSVTRRRLLSEVVEPYRAWKHANGAHDFNDLAVAMMHREPAFTYDVIVVDEAQDLSANQLRAVMRHAAVDATVTIVTDSTQRIYPRGAPWSEAGITIAANRSFRLRRNYRNTRQIASLAASIAQGLGVDEDGTLPDPSACRLQGPLPTLVLAYSESNSNTFSTGSALSISAVRRSASCISKEAASPTLSERRSQPAATPIASCRGLRPGRRTMRTSASAPSTAPRASSSTTCS